MAFKFPFTNYHELNLTWVLEQLKSLFEKSEENVETIETYDNRLSAVESEVSTLETTTSQAINTANAAATNAATALSRANTANENALTASSQAGAAVTAAQEAKQEAQTATQTAQQAQATAMTFDGRITQAEDDASAAIHAAQSFENRVNAAINTANNAANTATIAQGIAVSANQTAAQALDELNAQRAELVAISEEQQEAIEEIGQQVIASIPADYTQLSEDVKNKAPLIVENASGNIVNVDDGADHMLYRNIIVSLVPVQEGTGFPTLSNVRRINGHNSIDLLQTAGNMVNMLALKNGNYDSSGAWIPSADGSVKSSDFIPVTPGTEYSSAIYDTSNNYVNNLVTLQFDSNFNYIANTWSSSAYVTTANNAAYIVCRNFSAQNPIVKNNSFYYVLVKGRSANAYVNSSDVNKAITWPAVGTIYNALYDIIGGSFNISFVAVDLGSLTWIKANGLNENITRFYTMELANIVKKFPSGSTASALCEIFRTTSANNGYGGAVVDCVTIDSTGSISCYPSAYYPTAEDFKAAVDGYLLVYELNTPQTASITPETLYTIYKNNVVLCNNLNVNVNYPADTKLYIDGKFTELQALILEH